KMNMENLTAILSLLLLTIPALSYPGVQPNADPESEERSAKGLQIQCHPATSTFRIANPVNLWCVVTNTTRSVKSIAWHPSAGAHFCLAEDQASWMSGILPQVVPKLRED